MIMPLDGILFPILIAVTVVLRFPMRVLAKKIISAKYKHVDKTELSELTDERERLRAGTLMYTLISLIVFLSWSLGALAGGYYTNIGLELNIYFLTFIISATEASNNLRAYRKVSLLWKKMILEEIKLEKTAKNTRKPKGKK